MFFLKPKPKFDEVLQPPPPPEAEFKEQTKEEPNFFEETINPEGETKTSTEEKEFGDLAKDLGIGLEPQKESSKKEKIPQKEITKEQKIPNKIETKKPTKTIKKEVEKIVVPKSKERKQKSDISKEIRQTKAKTLPKEKEFEDFGKDLRQEKPKEILEAEEEIKSAIDKIKEQEKPSLFKRLFSKKKKVEEKTEEHLMPKISEVSGISMIQNSINKAREALIKCDLERAKINYIEVMEIYNKIKPEEQAKVYHDIKELYFERKSAEGLKA